MRIDWVKCGCGDGYSGPLGVTCSRCEGSGMREVVVREKGDCRTCNGFGKIAILNKLLPCPEGCGSTGHEEV